MTVPIFDRLTYIDRLKAAGISEANARAHADSLDLALRDAVATKADIDRLDGRFVRLEWMIGFGITLSMLIMGKLLFFAH